MKINNMVIIKGLILSTFLVTTAALTPKVYQTNSPCIQTFNKSAGEFTTQNYPLDYPINIVCGWVIEASESGADIAITFHDFKLEISKRCIRYDHVAIYKKVTDSSDWETFGFAEGYCGNLPSFSVSTKAKRVLVEFVSDKSGVFPGFNATYFVKVVQGRPVITCFGLNADTTCNHTVVTEETSTLTLSCLATSIPPPQYKWSMRNASNPNATYLPIPTQMIKNIFSNGSIQLHNLQIPDTNIYQCMAFNDIGNSSDRLHLIVREKCRCPKVVTTNWYPYNPYTPFVDPQSGNTNPVIKGIFHTVLQKIIRQCCGNCSGGHGVSSIDFGDISTMKSRTLADAKTAIESNMYDLSFPISGGKRDDRYRQSYWFIPTVDSPGVAFYVAGQQAGQSANAIFDSVIQGWPILVLTIVMAILAGIIMWGLDTYWNEEQFPRSFTEGVVEGFWWAFVTMTTVGYGDIAPIGIPGRIFAIMWILTGLVIISIFTGVITTSLTVTALENDVSLYGTRAGAIHNTAEFRLGVIKNANMTNYTNFYQMASALSNGDVRGVLVDAYVAAHEKAAFSGNFRVNKILTSTSAYGFVLGPRLSEQSLYQCFATYVEQNKQQITSDIEANTNSIEEPKGSAAEETTAGLFDPQSSLFIRAVVASTILLVMFSIGGILFEYGYLRPRHRMIEAARQLEMVESEAVKAMARRAQALKDTLLCEVQEFYDHWNQNLSCLTKKHKLEQKKLLERGTSWIDNKTRMADEAVELDGKNVSPADSITQLKNRNKESGM